MKIETSYAMAEKIPKKGSMHQVKDVPNPNIIAQFQLYLQNVALMAKIEVMYTNDYNEVKSITKRK